MQVNKSADLLDGGQAVTWEQMDKINRYTKRDLEPEEVYVFSLRLCDNQVDRDGERFDTQALPVLAELFQGKTCICDHQWVSGGQVARIFDAEVVEVGDLAYVKGWGYTLATQEQLVAELEAGIKKEVSVGCAMGSRTCSICGQDYDSCSHQKGQVYKEQSCHVILGQPQDAYEVSFVAVPAQMASGVLKKKGGEGKVEQADAELEALGRIYRKKLKDEVVSMGLTVDLGMEKSLLMSLADRLEPLELAEFHDALGKKFGRMFQGGTQLPQATRKEKLCEDEFLI
ncbi:MAG: hypothetical protein R3Y62_00965 [Eubacteriales bacterium]